MKTVSLALCFLFTIVFLCGCGTNGASSGDLTRAAQDLTAVPTALQDGITASSASTTARTSSVGSRNLRLPTVYTQSTGLTRPAGWSAANSVSREVSYTWTTSGGTPVTIETSSFCRNINASGEEVSWASLTNYIIGTVTIEGLRQQTVVRALSPYCLVETVGSLSLPSRFSLPLSMVFDITGTVTYLGSVPTTLEVDYDLTMNLNASADVSGITASIAWSYVPTGEVYANYYGTFTVTGISTNATCIIYQDLTNDGTNNGSRVGTFAIEDNGAVITLDNGTTIRAGG